MSRSMTLVVVGAAAAAGELRRLVQDDALAAPGKLDRRRKAGQPGADDMHRTAHQAIP